MLGTIPSVSPLIVPSIPCFIICFFVAGVPYMGICGVGSWLWFCVIALSAKSPLNSGSSGCCMFVVFSVISPSAPLSSSIVSDLIGLFFSVRCVVIPISIIHPIFVSGFIMCGVSSSIIGVSVVIVSVPVSPPSANSFIAFIPSPFLK